MLICFPVSWAKDKIVLQFWSEVKKRKKDFINNKLHRFGCKLKIILEMFHLNLDVVGGEAQVRRLRDLVQEAADVDEEADHSKFLRLFVHVNHKVDFKGPLGSSF